MTKYTRELEKLPDEISVTWCIDDIKTMEEDNDVPDEDRLTDDECREVLQFAVNKHDATIGINWDVLGFWADEVRSQCNQ